MHTQKPKAPKETDLHTHYELGVLAQEFGRNRKAIAEYKKEIARTDYYKAHYNLGTVLEQQRRYAEAIKEFKKVIQRCPSFYLAYNYIGLIYAELKQYANAIKAYSRAIQLNKRDPIPICNLGLAYDKSGQYRKASAAFRKALTLAPRHLDALKNLGDLLICEGISVTEGLNLLQKAKRITPDDPEVLACLAVGYLKQGRQSQATKSARRAQELAHNNSFVLERVRMVKRDGFLFSGKRKSEGARKSRGIR
jgi:tetratricopeptide (TPR) repeat protein